MFIGYLSAPVDTDDARRGKRPETLCRFRTDVSGPHDRDAASQYGCDGEFLLPFSLPDQRRVGQLFAEQHQGDHDDMLGDRHPVRSL